MGLFGLTNRRRGPRLLPDVENLRPIGSTLYLVVHIMLSLFLMHGHATALPLERKTTESELYDDFLTGALLP